MENVIEIKNLNKKYEDFSLNGITLDIPIWISPKEAL